MVLDLISYFLCGLAMGIFIYKDDIIYIKEYEHFSFNKVVWFI